MKTVPDSGQQSEHQISTNHFRGQGFQQLLVLVVRDSACDGNPLLDPVNPAAKGVNACLCEALVSRRLLIKCSYFKVAFICLKFPQFIMIYTYHIINN
jgi:hypothetical protein